MKCMHLIGPLALGAFVLCDLWTTFDALGPGAQFAADNLTGVSNTVLFKGQLHSMKGWVTTLDATMLLPAGRTVLGFMSKVWHILIFLSSNADDTVLAATLADFSKAKVFSTLLAESFTMMRACFKSSTTGPMMKKMVDSAAEVTKNDAWGAHAASTCEQRFNERLRHLADLVLDTMVKDADSAGDVQRLDPKSPEFKMLLQQMSEFHDLAKRFNSAADCPKFAKISGIYKELRSIQDACARAKDLPPQHTRLCSCVFSCLRVSVSVPALQFVVIQS